MSRQTEGRAPPDRRAWARASAILALLAALIALAVADLSSSGGLSIERPAALAATTGCETADQGTGEARPASARPEAALDCSKGALAQALPALPARVAESQARLAARERALFESPPAVDPTIAEEVRAAVAERVAAKLKTARHEREQVAAALQRFPIGIAEPTQSATGGGSPGDARTSLSVGTLVADDFLTHTTWTPAGSPYVLTDTVFITRGAVLTIEAGVTVRFDAMRTINVIPDGALRALGTPLAPITFTSAVPQPGAWNSVMFSSGSSGRLSYVSVLYAGASEPLMQYQAALGIYSPDVVLDHVTVAYSAGYPLYLSELPVLGEGNIFRDNSRNAIFLHLPTVVPDQAARMPDFGIPYEAPMGVNVYGTLTIDPGVTLRIGGGALVYVGPFGRLMAAGTAARPIAFRSSSPTPMPGDWQGIFFDDFSHGVLAQAIVEHSGIFPLSAISAARSSLSIRHVTIARTSSWPILILNPEFFPDLAEIEVVDNPQQSIFVSRRTVVDAPRPIRIPGLSVPYYVRGLALKRSTLIVEPGAWLEFEPLTDETQPAGLTIGSGARLEAAGSFTRPITMTVRAATVAASDRASGARTMVPAAVPLERWPGVWFTDPSSSGTISHTRLEYAGQDFTSSIAVSGASLSLFGSRITAGAGAGVAIMTEPGSPNRVLIVGNTIEHHDYAVVHSTNRAPAGSVTSSSQPGALLYHNNVADNRLAGVVNLAADASVDARLNWWGSPSGPGPSSIVGSVDAGLALIGGVRVPATTAVLSGTTVLAALDGSVRITVPAGAIPADTLYLSPLTRTAVEQPGLIATDYAFAVDALAGRNVVAGPFSQPVSLTIPIDQAALGGLDPRSLRLFSWDRAGQTWRVVPNSAYDPAAGAVVATAEHFTEFQIFSGSTPPTTATPTPTPTPTRTGSPTPTATATPTPTPTMTPAGSWVTLLSEDFEGDFPADNGWLLVGNPTWGGVDCFAYQGNRSGWPTGSADVCSGSYRRSQNAWMIWGPFSLADASRARLDFQVLSELELGYDWLQVSASVDGNTFSSMQTWTGSSNGTWQAESVDLASAPTIGRLLGQGQVWIAFRFVSDGDFQRRGSYIDDVQLQVFLPAGVPVPTATPTPTAAPASRTPTPSPTATATPSPTRTARPGWTTLLFEDFEGAFPEDNGWWLLGKPTWNDVACFASSGNRSGWPSGSAKDCTGYYRDIQTTAWMIWGPFSLADASQARLDFDLLLDTEENFDWLYVRASVDGNSFYPIGQWSGSSNGQWLAQSLDLAEVPGIGGLIGRSQVWIAFHSFTTYQGSRRGPYVDEIELRVVASGSPTPTSTPSPRLGSLNVANATDASFSVLWTTDGPTAGFVRYGITTTAGTRTQIAVVPDVRGAGFVGQTHLVQVGGVDPATGRPSTAHNLDAGAEYWIEVLTADAGPPLDRRTVRTGALLDPRAPDGRFGVVRDRHGNAVSGALVQATLVDADARPTMGVAALLATVTNDQGLWLLDLGMARTPDLAAPFLYAEADHLRFTVDAGSAGLAVTTTTVAATSPLSLMVEPVAVHSFQYGPGWNAVALPVRPLAIRTLGDLVRHLNGEGQVRLTRAYRYVEGGWDGATVTGTTLVGSDFELAPGEGYFLAMAGRGTWELTGYVLSDPPTSTLRAGWNLVGVPVPTNPMYASDVVASARDETGAYRVTEAHRWVYGGYEGYIAGYPLNDFRIAADQSYFLRSTTAFAWRAPLPGNTAAPLTAPAVGW